MVSLHEMFQVWRNKDVNVFFWVLLVFFILRNNFICESWGDARELDDIDQTLNFGLKLFLPLKEIYISTFIMESKKFSKFWYLPLILRGHILCSFLDRRGFDQMHCIDNHTHLQYSKRFNFSVKMQTANSFVKIFYSTKNLCQWKPSTKKSLTYNKI